VGKPQTIIFKACDYYYDGQKYVRVFPHNLLKISKVVGKYVNATVSFILHTYNYFQEYET
jgi:hypothetical protein